jgi:hypothetical protein
MKKQFKIIKATTSIYRNKVKKELNNQYNKSIIKIIGVDNNGKNLNC